MVFQGKPGIIEWRIHFRSNLAVVHRYLTTAPGRAEFWAESAEEKDGYIEFRIHNYPAYRAEILKRTDTEFCIEYFGTTVSFALSPSPRGGTILRLRAEVEDDGMRAEMTAGWVSVLMAMKAAVDYGADLRNHDPHMSWEQGFADN